MDAGQGHGSQHDRVVAERRQKDVSTTSRTRESVAGDDMLNDRHHEVTARLDYPSTEYNHLRIDQVTDRKTSVSQNLRRPPHDLRNQGIPGRQGLAQRSRANNRQVAVEHFREHGLTPRGHGRTQVALNSRTAGERLQATEVPATTAKAADFHDDVANLAGRFAGAAPQLAFLDKTTPDPGAHQDTHHAFGVASGTEPSLAQRAEITVVAEGHRHLVPVLEVSTDGHSIEIHVGSHHHPPRLRINHPGHGNADGRQIAETDCLGGDHGLHDPLELGDNVLRSAFAGSRYFFSSNDPAATFDQRGLDLGTSDVNA
jgi:hypothetical protein